MLPHTRLPAATPNGTRASRPAFSPSPATHRRRDTRQYEPARIAHAASARGQRQRRYQRENAETAFLLPPTTAFTAFIFD